MPAQTMNELRSHEEHRWSYMTSDQLQTRLGRIRNPDKLACFIAMAFRSHGPDGCLERIAWSRAAQLGIGSRVRTTMSAYNLRFTEQVHPSHAMPSDPDIDPEPDTKPEPKKKVKRRVIRFKRRARQLQLKSILNDE